MPAMPPGTIGIFAGRRMRGARILAPIAPVSPVGTVGASGPGTRVVIPPPAPGMRRGRIAGIAGPA